MSVSFAHERSLFSFEEFEPLRKTHHPFIYDLTTDELIEMRSLLRDMRDKEKTLARQKHREARGKVEPRGGSFPGVAEHPEQRKQVFKAALRRVSKELKRQQKLEANSANIEAAEKALAMRRSANFRHHPEAGKHWDEGMQSLPSRKRKWKVPPMKVGSVSQWNKRSQAKRDS